MSMGYGNMFTMSSLQTTLDTPSLVFLTLTGTCSLNRSYGYAFGRRHLSASKILRDHRIT